MVTNANPTEWIREHKLCSVQDCGNKSRRNGLCPMHSSRMRRNGSTSVEVLSLADRFWSKVTKSDDCWNWIGTITKDGYGHIEIDGKVRRAHRVSWEFSYGPIERGLMVLHKCDNRACVRPDHLFLGTNDDNMRDMRLKGRSAPVAHDYRGERNPNVRLTTEQAARVKHGNERACDLAREFGVPHATVHSIRRGKNWRHL